MTGRAGGFALSVLGLVLLPPSLAAGIAAPSRPSPARTEWTQFRLGDDHNAVVPGTLRVSWRAKLGGPVSSSPAVSGSTIFIGDNGGRMSAFDVRTGRLRWSRALENPIMTSPIVVGRNVIVGEGNDETYVERGVVHIGGGTSALVAFDRDTGATTWMHRLRGTAMPTPALIGGDLVEHDGNSDVIALDPANGAARYVASAGTAASMSAIVPLGESRFAIAGQTETSVRGVNAADGSIAWTHPMPGASGVGDCPLVLGPGRTLIGDYLQVVGDEAYVQAGKPNREHAYALDAATGDVRWDVALETGIAPRRNQAAIPIVDGETVYLGSSVSGFVHALDVRSGRVRWRHDLGAPVKSGGVAVDGVLYVGDAAGVIWALDERDGSVAGRESMGVAFNVGSPIVVGRTLIVGAGGGTLLALPLDLLRASSRRKEIVRDEGRWLSGGMLRWFRQVDRDGDGAIERWEYARAVADGRAPANAFARLDVDRDGLVSPRDVRRDASRLVGTGTGIERRVSLTPE